MLAARYVRKNAQFGAWRSWLIVRTRQDSETLTLRSLECDGLVKRTAYATIPPRVEYELTKLGRSLIEPLKTLAAWAKRNRPVIEAARAQFEAAKAQAD